MHTHTDQCDVEPIVSPDDAAAEAREMAILNENEERELRYLAEQARQGNRVDPRRLGRALGAILPGSRLGECRRLENGTEDAA